MESSFNEKVKERLSNPANYLEFTNCINSYKRGHITQSQLQSVVKLLHGLEFRCSDQTFCFFILLHLLFLVWGGGGCVCVKEEL